MKPQLTSARELSIMETQKLRERVNLKPVSTEKPEVATNGKAVEAHPGGDIKHGGSVEILRLLLMITYFLSSTCSYVRSPYWETPLTGVGSALRNSSGCLCTGTIRISTTPIWHSRNNPLESTLQR